VDATALPKSSLEIHNCVTTPDFTLSEMFNAANAWQVGAFFQ
jgi:hypothetical protein